LGFSDSLGRVQGRLLGLCLGLFLRSPIQQRQVCLPANSNDAGKGVAVLHGDEGEAEGGDKGPQAERHDNAGGNSCDDAVKNFGGRAARQQGLGAEEVGVKGGREEDLGDENLGANGQYTRGVIEVMGEPNEPRRI
jgi:hypothetical protein